MKRYKNRSGRKRRLFEAVVRGWNTHKWNFGLMPRAMAAGAMMSFMGAPAHAEEPATGTEVPAVAPETPAAETSTEMPEVVVTGEQQKPSSPRYTEPLRNIPQTITIIPQETMKQQGATTLRDVLRNVPGISIQAGEGGVPAGDNLSVRGFSARTDLFIDGIRDFGGYSRDSFNTEQVEVSKGPSSSYSGRGSTGGSVNLASKTPKAEAFREVSLGVGTEDYFRGTLDVNQPIPGTTSSAFRLNAMWHENDTPRRTQVDNQRWGFAPSLAFGLGTPTRMNVSYFHLEQDNTPDYGIPFVPNTNTALSSYADKPAPVDFDNFYGLKAKSRDYEKTNTDIMTHTVEHDMNEYLRVRNIFRYGRTVRDSIITAPRFNANGSTAINRQVQSRDQTDTILADQVDFLAKLKTGPIDHSIVTGVDFARETSKNYARAAVGTAAPLADLFNPNPEDTYLGAIRRTGGYTEALSSSVGLYLADTLKFGEHWELLGGVRWDSFNVDFLTVSTFSAAVPLARADDMFSWRTGLVFKPTNLSSIYAAYGTSFNPSAEGLTLGNTATSTNGINTDPEETHTTEVGGKWDLFRKLALSAAVFRTEKINARTEDPANAADIIVLDGEQRVDGLELGAAGNITDKWMLSGGFTYMDSEVTKSKNPLEVGRQLANTPRQSASVWTSYNLPFGFQVGAGGQYVSSRYNSSTTPRLVPDYCLYDAMLAYNLGKHFTVRLNAYNLTDVKYIDRVGGGHFIPGAGRSATLTTDIRF